MVSSNLNLHLMVMVFSSRIPPCGSEADHPRRRKKRRPGQIPPIIRPALQFLSARSQQYRLLRVLHLSRAMQVRGRHIRLPLDPLIRDPPGEEIRELLERWHEAFQNTTRSKRNRKSRRPLAISSRPTRRGSRTAAHLHLWCGLRFATHRQSRIRRNSWEVVLDGHGGRRARRGPLDVRALVAGKSAIRHQEFSTKYEGVPVDCSWVGTAYGRLL